MTEASPLDPRARGRLLDQLERERVDCLVIGGGITGAGIAREASQRGLSVALFEARDFASGTSSRSSKLIHGGLRYLAMGDVGLVRSTALERKVIHRLAPHLAEPRWLLVPARSRVGLMKLRTGITTYEKLGAVAEHDLHRNYGRDELAVEEPLLNRERFAYGVAYREYLTNDARLVLANIRAAAAHGAVALNRCRVEEILGQGGRAEGALVHCELTDRRVRVRARCVINAAGPWVDAVRRLEEAAAPPRLHLSKGVHIVIPAERLPIQHMVLLNTEDRRSIFVIPTGSTVYVGTTDTTYEPGAATWPVITRADVEYLLAPLARDFSVEPIAPEEVAAAWAGLRPLIAEPGKSPREISRKDEVWIGPQQLVTIAGGKLTGYRPMAQLTLEKAAEACGITPAAPLGDEPPLPGGDFDGDLDALASRVERECGVSPHCAARLARLYGTEAIEVAKRDPTPLDASGALVAGEVEWGVAMEGASHLLDMLYRRTGVALYEPAAREAVVEPIAERMAALLGWSPERRESELAEARGRLQADLTFVESESA
jgi:glycerol-3-phosphate dehydrogenase